MSEFRTERDSMGDVQVPAQAYYGAQTQRAVQNFPISGLTLTRQMIRSLGLIKGAAAVVHHKLGMMDESMDKEALEQEPQDWEFRAKPAWQRLIVMLGGIIVNVIVGIIIF